jgi:hypothetical protein
VPTLSAAAAAAAAAATVGIGVDVVGGVTVGILTVVKHLKDRGFLR